MQNIRKMGALLGAGVIMLGLAGCGNKDSGSDAANAVSNNMGDTANAAVKGGEAVANGAADAGKAVVNGAADAGKMVANGAANVGKAASEATLTPQIKTALGGNKALNGSMIDVDTNTTTKVVTLKGTVKSPAQKTMAEMIAKQKATGYKVVNQLKAGK